MYTAALAALKKFEIDGTDDNETAARVAVSGVALVAQHHVWKTAQSTLEALCRSPRTTADSTSRFIGSWNQMVQAMRTDVGVNDPWQPATTNPPKPNRYEGAIEPTPAGEYARVNQPAPTRCPTHHATVACTTAPAERIGVGIAANADVRTTVDIDGARIWSLIHRADGQASEHV